MLKVLSNNTSLANFGGRFDDWEAFNHGIILYLLRLLEFYVAKTLMPQYTNLISMSHKCGGLCIRHKMGELVGFCMMVYKAFCYKFFGCKFCDIYIILDKGDSLGHSHMFHLINTKEV